MEQNAKFDYGKQSVGVVELVNYLKEKKQNQDFKVLDVGGDRTLFLGIHRYDTGLGMNL